VKIHLLQSVHGNFGDELNRWLWPAVLPGVWDDDSDTLFVGIGTILDKHLPPARSTVVFGTGAGYTPPPADVASDAQRWRIYGVRGPLTARALQLDHRLAMTDPAILLATLPEFRGLTRRGVIFIPHWKSVRYGYWQQICADLGVEFVDPCADSKSVVGRIASADKVIAESMHAAIIADAFRVPWVPVALSREVSPFKWVDWAASVEAPYHPICLPASNRIERLRNTLLKWSVHANAAGYPTNAMVAKGHEMHCDDLDQLMRDFHQIMRRINQPWRWNLSVGMEVLMKRLAKYGLDGEKPAQNSPELALATARLDEVRQHPGYLSTDLAHTRALERTLTRLQELERDSRRDAGPPVRASA
jgi:succinoglycan biosynthesis protein ExoV